jgi:predicted O-methyltransferase YrrM
VIDLIRVKFLLSRIRMSATLQKIARIAHQEGLRAVVRGATIHLRDAARAVPYLRRKPRFASVGAMLTEPQAYCGRTVKPYQVPSEIATLLTELQRRKPRLILEIGTANGGTLFLWTRIAAPDATIVSVDLPGGAFGDGYPAWRAWLYRQFPIDQQSLHLIRGNSHTPETRDRVRDLLPEIDFLFIDGDHTYDGVKADFDMYAPLVRPGGLIALHDVAEHPPASGCDVARFWRELQETHRTTELIANPHQNWAGIGLVEV